MRTSGELGYPTPTCTALLGNGNQRASPNLRAPCRFFFGIAQRKSLAKRKARENPLLNLTSNIDERTGFALLGSIHTIWALSVLAGHYLGRPKPKRSSDWKNS